MLCNSYDSKILHEEFHWIYLPGEIKLLLLLLITGLYLKSKSFTTYRVTLYILHALEEEVGSEVVIAMLLWIPCDMEQSCKSFQVSRGLTLWLVSVFSSLVLSVCFQCWTVWTCRLLVHGSCLRCRQNKRSRVGKLNLIYRRSRRLLTCRCRCRPLMSLFPHHRRHEGRKRQKTLFQNRGSYIFHCFFSCYGNVFEFGFFCTSGVSCLQNDLLFVCYWYWYWWSIVGDHCCSHFSGRYSQYQSVLYLL